MKHRTTGLRLSKKLAHPLYLVLGLGFISPLVAADCPINYDQASTISADCDGFTLDRNQDFDISIITGVNITPFLGGSDNIIGLNFDMGGVLTNNGTIENTYGNTAINLSYAPVTVNTIVNTGNITASRNTINIGPGSTLNLLSNAGVIYSTNANSIYNQGSINSINNSGQIQSNSRAIYNADTLSSLTNTNRISAAAYAIDNEGTLGTITNSGTISASLAYAIHNAYGNIESINNTSTGEINSGSDTIVNGSSRSITSLINQGDIDASADAAILNNGTISTLNNSGNIFSLEGIGIENDGASGVITNLTNSGNISAGTAISNTTGTIETITNTGSLWSLTAAADIHNNGYITTLINGQGGNSPLSLSGNLPANYQIIIASTSNYGKITFTDVTGTTTFDIHATSSVNANTTYTDVITGISDAELSATTGTFTDAEGDSYDWSLSLDGASYDLVLGACEGSCVEEEVAAPEVSYPSAVATQATVDSIATSINAQFSSFAMTTNFANLNTYDCGLFDQNNGCFSLGGRYTDVNGNNNSDSDSTALVMVGGYKVDDTFRIAGFVDQMVNNSTPTGIKIDNQNPMLGVSLVWNQHANHLGYQFKLANAYQSKDVTITRTSTGDAEAGAGSTDVTVNSIIAEASYQFLSQNRTSYRPYFAGRYAKIKQDGYTETNVDNGLTYQDLEDESITLIMGVKAKHLMTEQLILNGSIGVEQDIYNDSDDLIATATNIAGITPVDINSDENKTRPVVSLGADYFISPTQRLSLQAQYQELAFTSTSAKTAYVNYTIGF